MTGRRRAVVITLVVGIFCSTVVLLGIAATRYLAARKAKAYAGIAISLMNEKIELSPALRQQLRIPAALGTRREVIVFLLLKALETDDGKYSGANYWLGQYLFDKDCQAALFYLKRQEQTVGPNSYVTELLTMLKARGCVEAPDN